MFKFIENAVADHRIRKIESELERDNATMGDIYELNTAMKLTKEGMNAGEAIDMAAEMRRRHFPHNGKGISTYFRSRWQQTR